MSLAPASQTVRLAPRVAFTTNAAATLIVEQGTDLVVELNAAAGPVLTALARGRDPGADAAELVAALQDLGLVTSDLERPRGDEANHGSAAEDGEALLSDATDRAGERLVPLHAGLELTRRCPARCPHCYLGPNPSGRPELETGRLVLLLDELRDLGTLFVTFTGGEPLGHPDFVALYNAARDRWLAVGVLTTGLVHDERVLDLFARRGLDGLQVSLHGATPRTHDRVTGLNGSFDRSLAYVDAAVARGLRVRLALTVTRTNLDEAAAVLELAEDRRLPLALATALEPRHDGSDDLNELRLDEAGLGRVLGLIDRHAPRLAGLTLDDPPCAAGRSVLAVDAHGLVHACLAHPDVAGNLRDAPLAAIWRDAPLFARLRALTLADLAGCPTCPSRETCDRCPALARLHGLSEIEHAPSDCLSSRLRRHIGVR